MRDLGVMGAISDMRTAYQRVAGALAGHTFAIRADGGSVIGIGCFGRRVECSAQRKAICGLQR